jgi:alpha-L-arabinofuranosidase
MGLLEFLEWCEDLKMQPVLAVYAGMALQSRFIATGDALKPLVQDALDEIEYVTADESTTWGARRAKDGHPAPFKLNFVEVGNEDNLGGGARTYEERFATFYDGIKAKYPDLKVIATYRVNQRTPDLVDDHFYRSAKQMERDSHHYDPDKISRTGPKVFVGEWATREGSPTPNLNAALGDSAWMTGMQRNSDLVLMHAYAPLFVNVNPGGMQWPTDLIGYNTLTSYGSPAYYAQVMFSQNLGDTVLPVELTPPAAAPVEEAPPHGGIGLATWNTTAEYKDIKVTHGDQVLYESDFGKDTSGWRPTRGSNWNVVEGAYRQTGNGQNHRTIYQDPDWKDYTLTLKARKLSGDEGFIIMVHAADADNFMWWNVGGWTNTKTGLEVSQDGEHTPLAEQVPVTVETNRWYDVRVEVKGREIKCYLDDKLISQGEQPKLPPPAMVFATASRADDTDRVILKFVNAQTEPAKMEIKLQGIDKVSKADAIVLSGNPTDVNSPGDPMKISPKTSPITDAGASFTHEFPAHSVTVLRLDTK